MIASLDGGGEPNTYTSTNSAWEFHRTFSGGKGKFTARLVKWYRGVIADEKISEWLLLTAISIVFSAMSCTNKAFSLS